jgi:hypothetical protein
VRLRSVAGIVPEVALLDGDGVHLFVAYGRCGDTEGREAFVACLGTRLSFQDRRYSPAAITAHAAETAGSGVVFADGASHTVDVEALDGIPPERAVATADKVWIADGLVLRGDAGEHHGLPGRRLSHQIAVAAPGLSTRTTVSGSAALIRSRNSSTGAST